MRRVLTVLASALAGYALGAALGYALIDIFSSNTHDKAVEGAMTAAFVTGPLFATIGGIAAFIYTGRSTRG